MIIMTKKLGRTRMVVGNGHTDYCLDAVARMTCWAVFREMKNMKKEPATKNYGPETIDQAW